MWRPISGTGWLIALGWLASCDTLFDRTANPDFCGPDCKHPPITGCATSADCDGGAVCEVATGACVQCTAGEAAACSLTTPVCTRNQCVACQRHDECASSACLEDGACAAEPEVAYVDGGGTDNAACTQATPCTSVQQALATGRAYVKLHGDVAGGALVNQGRSVSFLADPGASLRGAAAGPVITVSGDRTALAIYDLTILGGTGIAGDGVLLDGMVSTSTAVSLSRVRILDNDGLGINVSQGALVVQRSTISGNVLGGIQFTARTPAFVIVNNVITDNGFAGGHGAMPGSAVAAVSLVRTGALDPTVRFEFNSISRNHALDNVATVSCAAAELVARNNIISASASKLVDGTCAHTYSLFFGGASYNDPSNRVADPMFADPELHLDPLSPARASAAPNSVSDLTRLDHDDVPRGDHPDIGAYQAPAS